MLLLLFLGVVLVFLWVIFCGKEECELALYKHLDPQYSKQMRGFLDIMSFLNPVLLCQLHTLCV